MLVAAGAVGVATGGAVGAAAGVAVGACVSMEGVGLAVGDGPSGDPKTKVPSGAPGPRGMKGTEVVTGAEVAVGETGVAVAWGSSAQATSAKAPARTHAVSHGFKG